MQARVDISVQSAALGATPTTTPKALGPFFGLAVRAPGVLRAIRPLVTRVVPLVSRGVRVQTRRNATRIFGRPLSPSEGRAFTRAVLDSFYEFILDVGQANREPIERLRGRIERVEGEEAYRALRGDGRGVVLVTAHMGSFEVGLAALMRVEQRVHVVYKRDASGPFEAMRARLRRLLGALEAPIDEGMSTWMGLRDALLGGDVVVMQADRAMPGQRFEVVPFLHGHLRLPTGAIRLARITGSPIVPVFTVRLASGRFAVHLCPAIEPGQSDPGPGATDPSLVAMARSIETMIARYPSQWLVLGAAFEEDAVSA
ncbi:MAG: lysophospholipid acyltransferase family protein [Phycisphaeraceae bacterium]|nr:lysophospholipid acyltransferase family protein [Phycisphaeraceae bacterium]